MLVLIKYSYCISYRFFNPRKVDCEYSTSKSKENISKNPGHILPDPESGLIDYVSKIYYERFWRGDFSRKQSESQGFEIPKKSHPKATSAHIPPAKFNLYIENFFSTKASEDGVYTIFK